MAHSIVLNSLYSVFYIQEVILDSCTTLIGHYIGSILLLYVADFLLVNIYTLAKRLRDKELRVELVETWRI